LPSTADWSVDSSVQPDCAGARVSNGWLSVQPPAPVVPTWVCRSSPVGAYCVKSIGTSAFGLPDWFVTSANVCITSEAMMNDVVSATVSSSVLSVWSRVSTRYSSLTSYSAPGAVRVVSA
jgi:hypothetical protein